jgi:glycogen debranching enzyme
MSETHRQHSPPDNQFAIHATAPPADDRTRVLKNEETFAVFDHYGDIRHAGLGEQGLYHAGTRFLSGFQLLLDGHRPLLLSSTVRQDNASLTVDLTNPDWYQGDDLLVPRDTLHILRSCFLWEGACYTRVQLRNYGQSAAAVDLTFSFSADYVDIFEVRGMRRQRRGGMLPADTGDDCVVLAYEGLDGVTRRTRLDFAPMPDEVTAGHARYRTQVAPREELTCDLIVTCSTEAVARGAAFEQAREQVVQALRRRAESDAPVVTSNEHFNHWWNRSAADLHMMVTRTPHGPYPYAGVPWFSTAFGRDGIISALQHLWLNPELARGVLGYLAAEQADAVDPSRDAQPGKILHETRRGEMAALGEIPFGRYYGSADATPLFVVLAGAYYRRTADAEFVHRLWPHVERALQWIDAYGDPDGDGLFEYARQSADGLVTQGWKDSWDSVFHADGSLAEPPVALCEIQAYTYAAWRAAADLALVVGAPDRAATLLESADELQRRFERTFWCEELASYALALDGNKRPCRVHTSNAGHCLFAGIASEARAARTARTLLSAASFSGWGIRTVAATEARYNPMGYHTGSIWPHDNALIAMGMSGYGLRQEVVKVFSGLFDASMFIELQRMPELLCGFERRPDTGPTLYPVACAPQSWAAGSVFQLLQACLGMTIDAPRRRGEFRRPVLPPWLARVTITGLKVGDASVDLGLERHRRDVGINLTRRRGAVEVLVLK